MVGCRHSAKNTLDRNYLWLAERLGAEVVPEREAGCSAGPATAGWSRRPRPGWSRGARRSRAQQVVLAAGVLGTLKLLLRSGLGGPRVGETRADELGGARRRLRRGAQTSTTRRASRSARRSAPDADAPPAGALPAGLEPDGPARDRARRRRRPRAAPAAVPRDARAAAARSLRSLSVRRWSERTVIVLAMQAPPERPAGPASSRPADTEDVDAPSPLHPGGERGRADRSRADRRRSRAAR